MEETRLVKTLSFASSFLNEPNFIVILFALSKTFQPLELSGGPD
jgi:hypothetical protein